MCIQYNSIDNPCVFNIYCDNNSNIFNTYSI